MVSFAIENEIPLEEIPIEKLKEFSNLIEQDYYSAIASETCVNERKVYGGPAPTAVKTAIKNGKTFLNTLVR
jgi:argininosuccinate lyase